MAGRNARVVVGLSLLVVGVGILGWLLMSRPAEGPGSGPAEPNRPATNEAAIPLPPPGAPGSLTGKVLVFGTNQPGAGIPLRIEGGGDPIKLETGEDGSFSARVPSRRSLTLTVEAPDPWAPATVPGIQVDPGGTEDLGTIYLTGGFEVRGVVLDGHGAGVAGADVRAYRHVMQDVQPSIISLVTELGRPREALDQTTSKPDGSFVLARLHPGTFRIEANAKGFAVGAVGKAVVSPATESHLFKIVLSSGVGLSGRVSDPDGKPVAGAVVTTLRTDRGARDDLDFSPVQTRSDEKGHYEFPPLVPGRLGLIVTAEGYPTRIVNQVNLTDSQTLDIVMGGSSVLAGKVTGPQDEAISGARVFAMVNPREGSFVHALTDDKGEFRVEHLPAGRVQMFTVEADGYSPWPSGGGNMMMMRDNGELEAGKTLTKNVQLSKGARVEGHVLDTATGRGVAGARVRTLNPQVFQGQGGQSAVADAEGKYVLEGVPEGTHVLLVQAAGYFQPGVQGDAFQQFFRPANSNEASDPDQPRVQIGADETVKTKDLKVSPAATISGTVLDPEGKPVAGAEVAVGGADQQNRFLAQFLRIAPPTVLTDTEGHFRFAGAPAGQPVTLTATAEGFVDGSTDPIPVTAGGEVSDVTIRLRAGATLTGLIQNADGSVPVGGQVRLIADSGNPNQAWQRMWQIQQAVPHPADDAGRFRVTGIAPGRYVAVAQAAGHLDKLREGVQLAEGAVVDLGTMVLQEGLTIEGIVQDPAGNAISGARISCNPHRDANNRNLPGYFPGQSATSDSEGRFKVAKLTPGSYDLRAMADGYSPENLPGINAGEANVRVEMQKGVPIEGRVLLPSGDPAAHVYVRARMDDQHQGGGQTDEKGHFRIENLAPGTYTLSVSGGGFRMMNPAAEAQESFQDTEVAGVAAGSTNVEIRLNMGLTITGTVVDAGGAPANGAFVIASSPQGGNSYTRTDEQGSFQLGGLKSGTYTLTSRGPAGTGSLQKVEAGATNVRIVLQKEARAPVPAQPK